jgi:hypothetical protein
MNLRAMLAVPVFAGRGNRVTGRILVAVLLPLVSIEVTLPANLRALI